MFKRMMMNNSNESFSMSGLATDESIDEVDQSMDEATIRLKSFHLPEPTLKPVQVEEESVPLPIPSDIQKQGNFSFTPPPQSHQQVPFSVEDVSPSTPLPAAPSSSRGSLAFKGRWRQFGAIAIVIGLLVVLGGSGLEYWVFAKKAPTAVTVYQVSSQNVVQFIGGSGIAYPLQRLVISYPITARVTNVLVKPGDTVSVNQPLLSLDLSRLNAQVAQAANDVLSAKIYLDSVSTSRNPITIAQAQQSYNLALNKYQALQAETSSATLHNGTLYSTLKGVVTAVNINPGDFFSANKPLITIMDESSIVVHADIPLSYLNQVHLKEVATVTPSVLPNLTLKGIVTTIVPQADPQTDTFEIWVTVLNANNTLLPGMSAFVRIQQAEKALVVPRLAVLNPDRESLVFIERDQHVYVHPVHIMGRSDRVYYIDSGIAPGTRVVLVGLLTLQDGQKVTVTQVEG